MDYSILQFSHANGFPARTYTQMLKPLTAVCEVRYIEQLGHNPRYPITDGWNRLVDELISNVVLAGAPVIGAGHSLGGVLTFFAAVRRPDLFRGIVLLDPPILNPLKASFLYCLKRLRLHSLVTPGEKARTRRAYWPNEESLRRYLETRPLFRYFDPQVLQDYIRYGTDKRADGYHLRFRADIEAQIYATLPHVFMSHHKHLQVPGVFLYGKDTHVVNGLDRWVLKKFTNLHLQAMPGTHLFPFEYPVETALAMKHWIKKWI